MDSYTQLNVMVVFGVKRRLGLITKDIRERVFGMISSIVNNECKGCRTIIVGGTEDHVHVFFGLSPTIAVSDVVRSIKSCTSKWLNENRLTQCRFEWQKGYGAFSYSQSARENVIGYIKNQEKHHERVSFREELEMLLAKYQIANDPRDMPHQPY